MPEEPKATVSWLEKWREKRRRRHQRRSRVAAHKVTDATRRNMDDSARWGGPFGGG